MSRERNSRRWTRIFKLDARSEIDEELAFHQEQRMRDYLARGFDPDAARAATDERLGDLHDVRSECTTLLTSERRTEARRDFMKFSTLDFKLGLRMLVRYPGLTLVGGLAMALAIAIGAAGYEAITQILSPALPFRDGERIVAIRTWDMARSDINLRPAHDFLNWREQLKSVEQLGAFRTVEHNLITSESSEPLQIAEVTATAFSVTGVAPQLGRTLSEADEVIGAPSVLVIGHDLWQSRFGGDRNVVGRSVRVGAMPFTVVGVMPEGFHFPVSHSAWAPLRLGSAPIAPGEGPPITIFGRLAAGVTFDEAQAELAAVGQRASRDFPATHEHLRPMVVGYARSFLLDALIAPVTIAQMLGPMLYSSNIFFLAFLVLICANVALLMFARAAAREAEIIVRSALGASRGRIITQLVAEALVLGSVAAMIGLATAGLVLRIAYRLAEGAAEGSLPFWFTASLSLPSILYAVVLTLIGATIAGALPALKVTRVTGARLREVAAGAGGLQFGGVWTGVIVAQVAFTVVFVAITVYVLQLTTRIDRFAFGFDPKSYTTVRLQMHEPIPATVYDELKRRVSNEPAAAAVTFANVLPGDYHGRQNVQIQGDTGSAYVQSARVDADYFNTFGIETVAGRQFRAVDSTAAGGVIVNEEFVEQVLNGRNAVGQRMRFQVSWEPDEDPWSQWHEIVGVVKQTAMGSDPEMTRAGFYRLLKPGESRSVHMATEWRGTVASFASTIRKVASEVDPTIRLYQVGPLVELKDSEVRWYRTWNRILIGASALVLSLSLAGIYAIMAFTVSRRTREIGIRVALGADKRRIVFSIFKRPLIQVGLGVASGFGLLILAMGGFQSLFAMMVITGFAILMAAVCMLACVVPMRRALRIDPVDSLRAAQ